jgi:signal transduction histidine kinase
MRRISALLRRPDPVIFVILAVFSAAALVIGLQHRALTDLDRQTRVILQKVSEQTALSAAAEIRRTFDGPIFDTLANVNHPLLAAGRLDLVADAYRRGLESYPQVERFFLWTDETERELSGEVVFFDRRSTSATAQHEFGPFYRDVELGSRLFAAARAQIGTHQIYAARSLKIGHVAYDVFIRVFYTTAAREQFFAVMGFVVNLEAARKQLFPELQRRRLGEMLEPKDGSPQFEMRVFDQDARHVFGPPLPAHPASARTTFAMQFYPADDIRTRMAATLPQRYWTLVISPRPGSVEAAVVSSRGQAYGLSVLSVLLMLVALAFTFQSRKRARQLARMQSDFVTHVSHQLKTPVSLLSAVAETITLDRVRSQEKLAQCLGMIRTQTAQLSTLVEQILEISRVGDAGRPLELETVQLGALVRETVEAFARALEGEGYKISVVEAGPTPTVAADPAALEQVLVNLLDNAVKYSGESRTIVVRAGITGSDAIVEVIDQGIGIEPESVPRIFERFYRGAARTKHRAGFGLGLSIAHDIVAAHFGRIEVTSAPGKGSTFQVRLPLLQTTERKYKGFAFPWRRKDPSYESE